MEPQVTFRVKFVNAEPDVLVSVESSASFRIVIAKIRDAKEWKQTKNVRLICCGRELFPGDTVATAPGGILHCIATEYVPPPQVQRKPPQLQMHPATPEDPPLDWLDIVDPGTVLMWIFGSILALLWVLFVFYAHMFDKTSLVMLCMMTFAFLIPCALSYMPGLTFLNSYSHAPASQHLQHLQHLQQQQRHQHHQHLGYEQAAAHSGAVSQAGLQQRQVQRAGIPPRPPARVQPLA